MVSSQEIKRIRSLKHKKYRQRYNQFIIEGARSLLTAIEAEEKLIQVYISESYRKSSDFEYFEKKLGDISTAGIPDDTMNKLSDITTAPGIIGVCRIPEKRFPNINSLENWIYLDKIRDPGNVGTLLRTAAWFGVKNIAFASESIDIHNPKVVRGAMGAHFHLSIYDNVELSLFLEHQFTIVGAFMDGESFHNLNNDTLIPWVLVLGNEAHGISPDIADIIHRKIAIPRLGSGESLNVAVAGGILMQKLTLS